MISRIKSQFERLYKSKAFLNQFTKYLGDGVEDIECARNSVAELLDDYEAFEKGTLWSDTQKIQ